MPRKPKKGNNRPGTAPSDSSGGAITPQVPAAQGEPGGGPNSPEFGNKQRLQQIAQAGAQRPPGAPPVGGGGGGGGMNIPTQGVFQPTNRPGEDPTRGVMEPRGGPNVPSLNDPNVLLREMARQFPHPDILRLLARAGG